MTGISPSLQELLLRLGVAALNGSKIYTLFRPFYGGIGHILMLHRVVPQKNHNSLNADIEITQKDLIDILTYFKKNNYKIVSLDEVYNILHEKRTDIKFVSFTFDDGYKEIDFLVYHLFQKYNYPFTVYLTTGFIDGTAINWWYALEKIILKNDRIDFEYNNKEYCFFCSFPNEKYNTFRTIRSLFLNQYNEKNIREVFRKYHISLQEITAELALDWEQVKKMSRNPQVTIGSHTASHHCLKALGAEAVKEDVLCSLKRLESQIQKKVEHFSYPFGRKQNGPREFAIIEQLGFKTATTTRFGNIFPGHWPHRLSLPRIYPIGRLPVLKYLDLLLSGALSALGYRFKRI
jgi:peptidoglycan/xylan/chitin deacetylase (PgdA/CDA1 family)